MHKGGTGGNGGRAHGTPTYAIATATHHNDDNAATSAKFSRDDNGWDRKRQFG